MFLHTDYLKIQQILGNFKHFAGLLATIIGVISFIPVLFTVHKTKKASNFPYRALILALTSNILPLKGFGLAVRILKPDWNTRYSP